MMQRVSHRWLLGPAIVLAVVSTAVAHAQKDDQQGQLLWRIGTPDRDYREFAIAGRYFEYVARFPSDVAYRVGESDPARDWPFIHPGPDDVWAGGRVHPFRIEFDLAAAPAGTCRLTIDLVNSHYGSPPILEVSVNERRKYRVKLPAGGTDEALTNPAAGRPLSIPIFFPGEHLVAGSNFIVLTAAKGSWFLYDAITLEGGLAMPAGPQLAFVDAQSTMFFRRENGSLKQAIRVAISNAGLEGKAELELSGARQLRTTAELSPDLNTVYLLVEPFEEPENLRLVVTAGADQRTVDFVGRPERKWRLYVIPSTHTDIGYTGFQEETFARHDENTALALDLCERFPGFTWNLEVAWQAHHLRRSRPQVYERLVQRLRDGRIGLGALYLNMLTGLCSGEEMVECLERAQRLAREKGFIAEAATLTDVPTAIGTLPMLLAKAGVRYFAEGINGYRAPVWSAADPRMLSAPFWWEGPDGSRVLTWLAPGYAHAAGLLLTGDEDEALARIVGHLRAYDRPDYPYGACLAFGAFGDNQPLDPRLAEVVAALQARWEYPNIILARDDEFFRYIEQRWARELPVFRGDMGVYWEDGAGSSAFETALVRWARARLETAQRRFALAAALAKTTGKAFPAEALRDAWDEILFYDEHTWGAWCSISAPESEQTLKQWEYKAAYAARAAAKAEALHKRSLAAMQSVAAAHGGSPRDAVVVFNEHSWPRDMVVFVRASAAEKAAVIGPAGRPTAAQPVRGGLVFLAENVPALGYRAYTLARTSPGTSAPSRGSLLQRGPDEWTWETQDLRLRFDRSSGAIASLESIHDGYEWVDLAGGHGLNEFLYALGGEDTGLVENGRPPADLRPATHTAAHVELVENGPVRAVLRVTRTGPDVPAVDSYLVFGPKRRLDIVNVVHKQATYSKEAGYFAFPFRFVRPEAARAYVGLPYGWITVEDEQLPGGCREWYCAQGFTAASDGEKTAILATPHAPLLTVGDIFRGKWRPRIDGPHGHIFAYVFNNYWPTNYKASQDGDLLFAFSLDLREGAFDPVAATRFGWERVAAMGDPRKTDEPAVWLAPDFETRPGSHPIRAESKFLQLGDRADEAQCLVLVGGLGWSDGRLVVRLYNPAAEPATVTVRSPWRPAAGVFETDLFGMVTRPSKAAKAASVRVAGRSVAAIAIGW